MLVLMQCVFFLRGAHTHPWLDVDIIIYSVDISICVMDNVVLHVPHKAVSTEYVQRKCRKMVHEFVFAKTSVSTIVHYIETDRGNNSTQQNAFKNSPYRSRSKEYKMDINKKKTDHKYHRLDKKTIIAGGGFTHFFKILTDPSFQLRMEGVLDIGKF